MKRLKSQAGFSLIELVLVILILGIALLPLVTQMMQSTTHCFDGQTVSTASFLARERLEQILGDENAPAIGYAGIVAARYPDESPVAGFPGYQRQVTISPDSVYSGRAFKAFRVPVASDQGLSVTLASWVVQ